MSFLTSRMTDEQQAQQKQLFLNAYNIEAQRENAEAKAEAARQKAILEYLYKEKLEAKRLDSKLAVEETKHKYRSDELAAKTGNQYVQDTLDSNRKRYGYMLQNTQSHLTSIVKDPTVADEYKQAVQQSITDLISGQNEYEQNLVKAMELESDPAKRSQAAMRVLPKFPDIGVQLEQYNDPMADQMNQAKLRNIEADIAFKQARTDFTRKKGAHVGKSGSGTGTGKFDKPFIEKYGSFQQKFQEHEQLKGMLDAQLQKERNPQAVAKNPQFGSESYKSKLRALQKAEAELRGEFGQFAGAVQHYKNTPNSVKERLMRIQADVERTGSISPILDVNWYADDDIGNFIYGGRQKQMRDEFRTTYGVEIDADRRPGFLTPQNETTNSFISPGVNFLTPQYK